MPATYTPSLRLTKPADGDINWGQTVNTGLTDLVDSSVAGTTTITMTAADYTLTNTNGTTDEARRMFIVATGSPGAPRNVICPAVSKLYFFRNDTAFTLTLKTPSGSGVAVPAGQYQIVYCNGTNVVEAANAFGSLTTGTLTAASLSLTTALAATSGGTGQNSYAVGDIIYASTTTALSKLADVATGNALISGGVGVAPSWGKIGLTTHVSGTLPATSGGTGQSVYAVGDIIYASSTTVLSRLADVATGNALISGGIGVAPSWGKIELATSVTGTLPVTNGGTGNTTIPAKSIFVANTLNTLSSVTPAAGQSVRINAGGTAWEAFTTSSGDAILSANNAFTGANTFYNNTGQTFGTATATQDGIIITGRAGGSNTYRITLSPKTLTASRAITIPDAAGDVVIDTATQTLTNKTLNSPTLVTPALGTPVSGVLTNCTGTAVGLTAGNLNQTTVGSNMNIQTANGPITIQTGSSTTTNTSPIFCSTGNATLVGSSVGSGSIILSTGSGSSSGIFTSGGISISTANGYGIGVNNGGAGGGISVTAGSFIGTGGPANADHIGGAIQITAGSSNDAIGTPGAIILASGSSTGGLVGADITLRTGTGSSNGKINFENCSVANGTVATTIASLGPTGSNTNIQGWLAVKINGTARYIPFW